MSSLDNHLISAAELGDLERVNLILKTGCEIDAVDGRGRTAIMAATHANHPTIVKVLIDSGANIHIQDHLQDNPFLYAGAEGLLDILKLTIAAGANTKLVNRYGGTALIPACHHGHPECVLELLTTTDVHIDHVNRLGWTALMETVILSDGGPTHQTILRMLLGHGANPLIADHDGISPIEHARRLGYREMEIMLDASN